MNEMVRVEWLDSGLSYTDGWNSFSEIIEKAKLATVTTVGLKFHEDDDAIYIALSVHGNDAYGVQVIAKQNIIAIDWLSKFFSQNYQEAKSEEGQD